MRVLVTVQTMAEPCCTVTVPDVPEGAAGAAKPALSTQLQAWVYSESEPELAVSLRV